MDQVDGWNSVANRYRVFLFRSELSVAWVATRHAQAMPLAIPLDTLRDTPECHKWPPAQIPEAGESFLQDAKARRDCATQCQ